MFLAPWARLKKLAPLGIMGDNSPETPQTSRHYRTEGFKGGPHYAESP